MVRSRPSNSVLIGSVEICTKNNVFQFDGHVFTQICGIDVSDLEEAFIVERKRKPDLWVCYIDDVFMIWSHTCEELDVFLQELNTRQEKIRFTAGVQMQSCNFFRPYGIQIPTF